MSSSKKTTKERIVKKSKLVEKLTYAALQNTAIQGKRQHGKSRKTTAAYSDGYIHCGREFLVQFADCSRNDFDVPLSGEDEDGIIGPSEIKMDPEFHRAFEGWPIKCTPRAISLFMAHKCFTEGLGKTTAESIHAAFLHHYSTM